MKGIYLLVFIMLTGVCAIAQDTLIVRDTVLEPAAAVISTDTLVLAKDTVTIKKHSPRKAAIRSAIIPGWGQVYNKKYWKVPIVYTAIGIPIGTFIYNRQWYNRTREAARMLLSTPPDTANYQQRVDALLYPFFRTSNPSSSGSRLLNLRNEYRKNMDYSILFTLLFWGLNVMDATVDAHLKEFDVSEDISLKIKPTLMGPSNTLGLSLVFTLNDKKRPALR